MEVNALKKHYNQLDNRDWLQQNYVVQLKTLHEIAAEIGCAPTTVKAALVRAEIPLRSMVESRILRSGGKGYGYPALKDPMWLRAQYEEEYRSVEEIAKVIGCSAPSVMRAFQKHGIETRTAAESHAARGTKKKRKFPLLDDVEWLQKRYVEEGLTTPEIAKIIGCYSTTVFYALKLHNIPLRPAGKQREGKIRTDAFPQLKDQEWLRHHYLDLGWTAQQIADEIGCTRLTAISYLYRWGIRKTKKRPLGEAVSQETPRTFRKDGYVYVWSPDNPRAKSRGYVTEHVLVVEKALGRHLSLKEVVHHLNEDRADNRLENLLVFPTNAVHMSFHYNPPAWVPRCDCCGHPTPEKLAGRPEFVPLLWTEYQKSLR